MENQELKAVTDAITAITKAVLPLYESVEALMKENAERKKEREEKKEPEQTLMSKGVQQYIDSQKSDSNLKGKEI